MLNFYLFTFGIARVCKWIIHTIAQILIKIRYYQKIGVKERDMNLYRRPRISSVSHVPNVSCARCRFLREADKNGKIMYLCAAQAMKITELSKKIQCLRFYEKVNAREEFYGIGNIATRILTWINSKNIYTRYTVELAHDDK